VPAAEAKAEAVAPYALLDRFGGKRTKQAAALAVAVQAAAPHARRLYEKIRRRGVYTIAVAGTDEIQPRSVLLLEDVDVYHAATDRDEEDGKVSVAAMLNALDGVWTPHGLITMMTTNNRDRLDAALVRAGRIDVDEEFTPLDRGQAARLLEQFRSSLDPQQFVGSGPSELIAATRATAEGVFV
jgi:AAA+ superfamily predicted ATPase